MVDQEKKSPASEAAFWKKVIRENTFGRRVVGWLCVFIGLLGLILPILPGIPFLAVGVALLSTEYRWARALLVRLKRKLGRWWPQQIRIPRARRKNQRGETHPS